MFGAVAFSLFSPGQPISARIAPTLLGHPDKQKKHNYLYWEDARQVAVRTETWKAIRPRKDAPFALYDLGRDIGEQNDFAGRHPDVLKRLKAIAAKARSPHRYGEYLDKSLGFRGHQAK